MGVGSTPSLSKETERLKSSVEELTDSAGGPGGSTTPWETPGASRTTLAWSEGSGSAFASGKDREGREAKDRKNICDGSAKRQTRITSSLMIAALGSVVGPSIAQGWSTGVLNSPAALIQSFLNETNIERFNLYAEEVSPEPWLIDLLWAVTVSLTLLGGCAGAVSAGAFAETLGRKRAILVCLTFHYISAVLFAFCKTMRSFEMLMLARFIMGYGCGAGSGLVPMYLTEISPVRIRGAMGTLHQFTVTFGILLSQIFSLNCILGTETLWPVLLCLYALPCTLTLLILPWFPDSPRYLLINKNKQKKAEKALRIFRGETGVSCYIDEMREEVRIQRTLTKWSVVKLIRCRELRRPLVLLLSLALAQQLSGINTVFFYSKSIFDSAGISPQLSQYANISIGLVNVLMTLISVRLMDRCGRRPLLLVGMLLMIISSIILTISLNLQSLFHWVSYLSIICLILFVAGFAMGLSSQFIGGEIFRQGPRATAMSLAGLINWAAKFIVAITYPSLQTILREYSFLIYTVFLVGFLILFWWRLPETKKKTYDQIYAEMKLKEVLTERDTEVIEATSSLVLKNVKHELLQTTKPLC